MELGKHVADKELLDLAGLRAGKVDDLLLTLPDEGAEGDAALPAVAAIVAGPTALSRTLPGPIPRLARLCYRLLGLDDPQPVVIPWERVAAIDVVVHLDLDRSETGLQAGQEAAARRYIRRIPGG